MDDHILLECIVFFNFLFFLLWSIFYTYQPWFLKDNDFIGPGDNNRSQTTKDASDKYLSDPGRSTVFLASLITSIVATIILYIILRYFHKRKQIKCKKGAKDLKECELITN
jgi:membrane protein DedA with SNARE-associated domain